MAVLRVDAHTLEVVGQYSALVAPERLADARPEALEVCGFSEAAWADAVPLRVALEGIAPLLDGALVAGHNVGFDWGFLKAGYHRAGLPLPKVDYHRLDTASLAWPLFVDGEVPSLSLDALAAHFGLERPRPHRALADARCALEVARRLAQRMRMGGRPLLEALAAVVEGEQPSRQAEGRRRRRRVYVCHPFADDIEGNVLKVRAISRRLLDAGVFPVAPHLYLPQLLDEATEREKALAWCLELLDTCDEVRVFGGRITAGMKRELECALEKGLPVRFEREGRR